MMKNLVEEGPGFVVYWYHVLMTRISYEERVHNAAISRE